MCSCYRGISPIPRLQKIEGNKVVSRIRTIWGLEGFVGEIPLLSVTLALMIVLVFFFPLHLGGSSKSPSYSSLGSRRFRLLLFVLDILLLLGTIAGTEPFGTASLTLS